MAYWAIAVTSETYGLIASVMIQDDEPSVPTGYDAVSLTEADYVEVVTAIESHSNIKYYWDYEEEVILGQMTVASTFADNKRAKLDAFVSDLKNWLETLYYDETISAVMVRKMMDWGDTAEKAADEAFLTWIYDVFEYAQDIKISIRSADLQYQLDAITWDFSTLESSDPAYSLP